MSDGISVDTFNRCVGEILEISDGICDSWKIHNNEKLQDIYLTKKAYINLDDEKSAALGIEFHVVYNISYAAPVLCFDVWRMDGTRLTFEEYWEMNKNLKDSNIYETLTQLDHPVLQRPFLTLHPCKTLEILTPFIGRSKNIIISWLSVVGPFVHLYLDDQYFKHC